MIRPVDSLVYLYYKCTKCGAKGDDIRLEEAKQSNAKHVCIVCGHVDDIEQIKGLKVSFEKAVTTTSQPQMVTRYLTPEDIKEVKQVLVGRFGISSNQAKTIVQRAISNHDPKDMTSLFTRSFEEYRALHEQPTTS